ncbi:MAG TPA: Minf_1886 family protein [Tepidisphaeraceae bacterium]|nr:Minf_1886 family protein [Tepidisphaeraceae bacterium]
MPPPADEPGPLKPLEDIIEEVGLYPREAFHFVQAGLSHTANNVHGEPDDPEASRHITGQQLCEGLRQFALGQWGMMARTVLARWNITTTYDFGRIVFALVDHGHMAKTEDDTIEDFRNVFDFATAFDAGYKIECKS